MKVELSDSLIDEIKGQVLLSLGIDKYVLVRAQNAGVHVGYLKSHDGQEVALTNSRRIWYWAGAASISQLAMTGTSQPDKCKFTCVVDEIFLSQVIEIITVTEKAKKSIEGVKVWMA